MNDNRQARLQSLSGGLMAEPNKANVCNLYESARPEEPAHEPPWVRRRVCGLRDLLVWGSGSSLPVVMFELNRWQVPDRGVQPVGVVPVDPAGDLPFDVAAVGPGWSGEVDRFCLEQPDGRFA
jgi:hypothetical protein